MQQPALQFERDYQKSQTHKGWEIGLNVFFSHLGQARESEQKKSYQHDEISLGLCILLHHQIYLFLGGFGLWQYLNKVI